MQLDDMILVSVDDHVVEPPDLFEHHLPAAWKARAPRVVRKKDGSDVWVFEGQQLPNIGLNAVVGRPPEEYGIEPTSFEQLRPGTWNVHERIRDMNANGVLASLCFPSFPGFCGALWARTKDKGVSLDDAARLQRLAHRRVVRRVSGPLHPARAAAALGSRS